MKQTRSIVRRCLAVALLLAIGWSAYGCSDSASINPEVELSSLTVAPGTLQPAFAGATTQYSVELSNNVTSVTVTAHPAVSGDTVSIDGQTTTSRSITVNPAGSPPTVVNIVVSESTSKSRTYTVVLNRAAGDNDLSALTVTPGGLSPAFTSSRQNYTVDVATDVTSVSVSATKSDPNAVLSGDVPNEGHAMIPLGGPGTNKDVLITVTAQNGIAKTYRVTIKRAAPMDNNNLSALSVNAGSLSPPFTPGTVNYSVEVAASVDRITVSATKSDPNAVMAAFGSVIAPAGDPSGEVGATPGPGATIPVPIIVTAPDGSQKTYTINVFRLPR
ncbi:MAG: cadherin-like beta sandwich domain-containing protein [Nitrospira sp.]|nr:cadherin-like beta sandwich domain-containing protein [Nitrospira sp.]